MGLFGTKMHYMMLETTAGDEIQISDIFCDLIVHIVQTRIHGNMILFLMNSDLF